MTIDFQTYHTVMFGYAELNAESIRLLLASVPPKLIRWMAIHHPDNRTRVHLYRLTNVPVGDDTVINQGLIIEDSYSGVVRIGNRVSIAPNVMLIAHAGANNSRLERLPEVRARLLKNSFVNIEDDAWIGARATILPGVTVGRGAVIGAGSVVTRDVSEFTVATGVPSRPQWRLKDDIGLIDDE